MPSSQANQCIARPTRLPTQRYERRRRAPSRRMRTTRRNRDRLPLGGSSGRPHAPGEVRGGRGAWVVANHRASNGPLRERVLCEPLTDAVSGNGPFATAWVNPKKSPGSTECRNASQSSILNQRYKIVCGAGGTRTRTVMDLNHVPAANWATAPGRVHVRSHCDRRAGNLFSGPWRKSWAQHGGRLADQAA